MQQIITVLETLIYGHTTEMPQMIYTLLCRNS
jgi:hypothetical protein